MKKTYHIITIGCQMNKSDSERIAAYLENLGFKPAKSDNSAGVVVLTTCGVRQSAEDRVYGFANKIKRKNPNAKLILTGCLSERKDVRRRLQKKVDIWLPINELPGLGEKLGFKSNGSLDNYLEIIPNYNSKISAFVPIGNGCNNFCAYCVVPYARGREIYRPAKEVISEVKNLVGNGYKEIVLIAQNVNSYINPNQRINANQRITNNTDEILDFADLLKMVNDIPGDFWIRFATSHPKDMSDKLIKTIAECEKVCRHIHLPAQAGDNEVLKRMNRKYTREHYIELIKKIRHFIPDISLTTDIIVGFPGEIKKQFNQTAKLFKEAQFDMAYIACYSPRFGTAAFKMEDSVSREEKKKRLEELTKILRRTALNNNKSYLGKSVKVLVMEKGRTGEFFGYTSSGKNVRFRSEKAKIGEFVNTNIQKVKDFGLEGEIAQDA